MSIFNKIKVFLNGPEDALNKSSLSSWDFGKDLQAQDEKSQQLLSKITIGLGKIVPVDDPVGTIGGWSNPLAQIQEKQVAQTLALLDKQAQCNHPAKAVQTHKFASGELWTRCNICGRVSKDAAIILDKKFTEELKGPGRLEDRWHMWGLEADLRQQEKPPVKISGLAADSIRVFREDKA